MQKMMRATAPYLFLMVLSCVGELLLEKTNLSWAAEEQKKPGASTHRPYRDEPTLPNGVVGVALQVGAERIGDPTTLHIAVVHPEGPARQAGLKHGDEVVTVNGTSVTGKTYAQVVSLIRGEVGTTVTIGVKDTGTVRELAIIRVASDTLSQEEMSGHGGATR